MQKEISLQGRVALVTGAATGIGQACALSLGAYGADVAINFLNQADRAKQTAKAIVEQYGVRAMTVQADVSLEDDVQAMIAKISREWGRLDILVSNAGIQDDAEFIDLSLSQWQKVIDVNLTGAFLCAREAVRQFLHQPRRPETRSALGHIIFTSSVHQDIPWAGHANYAASKGGLMMLMKSLAQELAGRKIRVNAVAPGAIKTEINREAWRDEDAAAELRELIPYGRIGDPEDVGRVVAWLASDAADYITGTTLFVDGGMLLYPGFRTGG